MMTFSSHIYITERNKKYPQSQLGLLSPVLPLSPLSLFSRLLDNKFKNKQSSRAVYLAAESRWKEAIGWVSTTITVSKSENMAQ